MAKKIKEKPPSSNLVVNGHQKIIIAAKNEEQEVLLHSLRNRTITIADGRVGTGKTYLAVAAALEAYYNEDISQIIFCRSMTEAFFEKVGYLPGDLASKTSELTASLFDAVSQIVSDEDAKRLTNRNGHSPVIKTLPIGYLRGISLRRTFAILEEAQICSPEMVRLFLTRIGEGSRFAVIGDSKQCEHSRNGLNDAIMRFSEEATKQDSQIGIVTLSKAAIVRHPLIGLIEDIYEK